MEDSLGVVHKVRHLDFLKNLLNDKYQFNQRLRFGKC